MHGLAQMKQDARQNTEGSLEKVAGQFEAIFMQMMVKEMRHAKLAEGMFDNEQSQLFQDMYDKQLSLGLSEKKGLGLKEIIMRQLNGQHKIQNKI